MKNENCFEVGTIQAFTDGELSSEFQEKVIGHIALCDSCATMLADTEEETAFAFSVLDEELNVLVPTERLRTKVFASIEEARQKSSWWSKTTSSLGFAEGFNFRSPGLVAFASVVLFVSALAIGVNFYNPMPTSSEVAVVGSDAESRITTIDFPKVAPTSTDINDGAEEFDKPNPVPPASQNSSSGFQIVKTGGIKTSKSTRDAKKIKINGKPKTSENPKPKVESPVAPPPSPNLSGEDSYLRTIRTLSRTVDMNKDLTLRPRERVAFERDMAVVDDAIKKLKAEVRKNPKNQAAREVLRSSYQNKIDLLNSVAEKTELMASIQ